MLSSLFNKHSFMKFSIFSIFALSVLALSACSKTDAGIGDDIEIPVDPPKTVEVPTTAYDITQAYSTLFEMAPQTTLIERQDYNELSGIAASRQNTGILYMHNDSKNSPILISNTLGEDLGQIILDGQSIVNPEDICVGPGPEN